MMRYSRLSALSYSSGSECPETDVPAEGEVTIIETGGAVCLATRQGLLRVADVGVGGVK